MKIYYVEAFCPVDSYKCHMPIEYELSDGEYRKVKCNCHNVREQRCDKSTECAHFLAAPDTLTIHDFLN